MAIICYDSERNLLEQLYQWDVNQTISVTGINTLQSPVFHFCNQRSEVALVVMPEMVDGMLTAEIPNSLLQEPETLFVYIYYNTDDDGRRTFYRIRVPVIPRQRPQNYVDTENINFVSAEILDAQLVTLIASMAENASVNMLAEVEDIRHGYDGTTYQSAGDAVRAIGETLSQANHEPNVFSFENETEYNRYYSNNTSSICPGDFIIIGDNSVFIKMRNSLELLFTTNDLYRKPIDGIPFEDLSADLQLRISEGGGSVTGPTYIIQGNNSQVFGFVSESAFTQYKALNPNDIHNGDYVWIKETTPFTKSYHLYVIDSQAAGGRTSIFDIDDTLLVTVRPGGVSGSFVVDHYLPDILEAYYNGTSVSLLTDYGVALSPSKYNVDNSNNPISVDFTGVFEYDGVYYGITYTVSQYNVVVSRKVLSKIVIEVESTATEGVYTISAVGDQSSWSSLNVYINHMVFNEAAAVVLHVDGNDAEYPCVRANQYDAYFGAFDPFNQVYVLFSIMRSDSTCTRNEIPFSPSQGSGGGATMTDGSVLKRYLALDVQTSLGKADTALQSISQQNFATAGDGFITSSSSSATTKTATLNGFVLTNGGKVIVKFTYAVGANATLNINNGTSNTGAKSIYYNGAKITANVIGAGGIALLTYNSAQNNNAGAYEVLSMSSGHKPSTGWAKTDFASSVQSSLDKADVAVPNSFGSANSGKPIVVDSNGEAAVGSWPNGGSGGGNYSGPTIAIPTSSDGDKLLTAHSNGSTSWQNPYSKLIVSYNSLSNTVDISPANIYPYWHPQTGNGMQVVLREASMGDYEIPLTFINSTSTQAVFSGVIRDYSAGTAKSVIYLVSSDQSVTKTVTPIGGTGTGYTGPTITTPGSSDADKVLTGNADGSTRWVSKAPIYLSNTQTESTNPRTHTSVSGFELAVDMTLIIKFSNALPSNGRLRINSTGSSSGNYIRYCGANITSSTIKAGDVVTLVFDGTYWVVTAIDRSDLAAVLDKIPSEATSSNQLADKSWVTQQIGQGGGGGSYTPEVVPIALTVSQDSTNATVALGYAALMAKITAGARFVSALTFGGETATIEWEYMGSSQDNGVISFKTVYPGAYGEQLMIMDLYSASASSMEGNVRDQIIGDAKAPVVFLKTNATESFFVQDNCVFECGTLTALTITSVPATGDSMIVFTSGSTPTNVSLPATITFMDGSADVVSGAFNPSANSRYEIIIRNRVAVVGKSGVSA